MIPESITMVTLQIDFSRLNLYLQPHVMVSLLQLNDNTEMNFHKIEKLVKSDQTLSGFILKASNSPLYARNGEIRKLDHAISLLGFRVIRSLATAAGTTQLFHASRYKRFSKYVWQHSVASAVIASDIVEMTGKTEIRDEAFIGALLHDLGKVILSSIDRKKYIEVLHIVESENKPYEVVENKIFGTNHMEIGSRAAREWRLPRIYAYILGEHNNVSDSNHGALTPEQRDIFRAAIAGNMIANRAGFGISPQPESIEKLFLTVEKLGISTKKIQSYTEEASSHVKNNEIYKFFKTLV